MLLLWHNKWISCANDKFNLYLCIIVTTVTVISITIKLIAMRFFDREQEFEKLREIEELSHVRII